MSSRQKDNLASSLKDLIGAVRGGAADPSANREVEAATVPPVHEPSSAAEIPQSAVSSSPAVPTRRERARPSVEPTPATGAGKRAVGKRGNPDYKLTGVYLRKSTIRAVKAKLLTREGIDMSDLAEEVLANWVRTQ